MSAVSEPRFRTDLLIALALIVLVELEVLLGPGGRGGSGLAVTALAVPLLIGPLAWRRRTGLLPLAIMATVLPGQALLGGFLVESPVTPLGALALALYSAGRHIETRTPVVGAVAAMGALVATRIVFDPAVERSADAVLTAAAVALPFLVGRAVRSQATLRAALAARAERLARDRRRDAGHAAAQECVRIATDLQAVVADGLRTIVADAQAAGGHLHAQDSARARAVLVGIASRARETLAEVRRVLGVLRREREVAGAAAGPPATTRTRERPPHARSPRPGPVVLDRTVVVALLLGAEIELVATLPSPDRVVAALSAVAIVTPLLWRRRWPVPVAAAVLAAIAAQSLVLGAPTFPAFDVAALVCATYTIGAHCDRRPALAGLVLATAGAGAHAAAFHPDAVAQALVGGVAVPWIVGRTLRTQRRLTGEREREAAELKDAREREARAAVVAERARVARDLHDAVAHRLSVIAIQAAGAEAIVERDPGRVAEVTALLESEGRDALAELGGLFGRGSEGGWVQPRLSLARVDALTQRAQEGGLPVDLRVEGEPYQLPAGTDLAAYRIVQEALANVSKHAGDARTWVVVGYGRSALELEVSDDGRGVNGARSGADAGHGLVGMRERAELYGGTLDAGPRPGGGFCVRARLPIGPP